jgi:hypothetical protein
MRLMALSGAALWLVPGWTPGWSGSGGAPGAASALCRPLEVAVVKDGQGDRYLLDNDNYGGRAECLTARAGTTRFTVSRSGADAGTDGEPEAYPDIYVGCAWKRCSPGSPLPARVSAIDAAWSTWAASGPPAGTWNMSYDLWFDRAPLRTGQATGLEIGIWLNQRDAGLPGSRPLVRLDGTRWQLASWITHYDAARWRLAVFRRKSPVWHAGDLPLLPFLHCAERRGWLRPDWYLLSIQAGFEIWRGGTGLRTTSFSAHVRAAARH